MSLHARPMSVRSRLAFAVASMVITSAIAVAVGGCGHGSQPASTEATPAGSSTTAPAQRAHPDTADAFGVTFASTTAGKSGVVVQSVRPNSRPSLKPGDAIIAVNDTRVTTLDDLTRAIGGPRVGARFTITVVRGRRRFALTEVQSPTAYLGAQVKDGTRKRVHGAVVDSVAPSSPAAAADLQHGDVITAADGASVGRVDALLQIIATHKPGDRIRLTLSRGTRRLQVTATLARRPPGEGG